MHAGYDCCPLWEVEVYTHDFLALGTAIDPVAGEPTVPYDNQTFESGLTVRTYRFDILLLSLQVNSILSRLSV